MYDVDKRNGKKIDKDIIREIMRNKGVNQRCLIAQSIYQCPGCTMNKRGATHPSKLATAFFPRSSPDCLFSIQTFSK